MTANQAYPTVGSNILEASHSFGEESLYFFNFVFQCDQGQQTALSSQQFLELGLDKSNQTGLHAMWWDYNQSYLCILGHSTTNFNDNC